jgi:thiamine biosynthesis protein ThiS
MGEKQPIVAGCLVGEEKGGIGQDRRRPGRLDEGDAWVLPAEGEELSDRHGSAPLGSVASTDEHARSWPQAAMMWELLRLKGLKPERVVVELNGEIVDKPRYGEVTLKENDTLEILGFVGGG